MHSVKPGEHGEAPDPLDCCTDDGNLKTVFLLGAGASYGSSTSVPVPPLGKDLYGELCEFAPVFAEVTSGLEEEFKCDFEQGMVSLIRSTGGAAGATVSKILAAYLYRFLAEPNSVYTKLLKHAIQYHHKLDVLLATLNYDLLIERSAGLLGFGIGYGSGELPPRSLRLLKLHGSCNLIPVDTSTEMVGNYWEGWKNPLINPDMQFTFDHQRLEDFLYRNRGQLAPGVCYIAPRKPILYGGRVTREHYVEFVSQLRLAKQLIIIGTAVRAESDPHLWKLIAQVPGLVCYIDITSSAVESFRGWADANREGPVKIFQASFAEGVDALDRCGFDCLRLP